MSARARACELGVHEHQRDAECGGKSVGPEHVEPHEEPSQQPHQEEGGERHVHSGDGQRVRHARVPHDQPLLLVGHAAIPENQLLAAGLGAVALPGPLGLGEGPSRRTRATEALTIAWYLTNPEWVAHVQSGAYRQWVQTQYAETTKA